MHEKFCSLLLTGVLAAAVIVNSGSTNTAGFRIVVEKSGKATYTATRRGSSKPQTNKLSKSLAKRFFADLQAARPLTQLPSQGCMKSASFGTAMTIELDGDTTPDLNCGDHGNSRMKALIQDVSEIHKLFAGETERDGRSLP